MMYVDVCLQELGINCLLQVPSTLIRLMQYPYVPYLYLY